MAFVPLSAQERVEVAKRWRHDLGKSIALWSANLTPEEWADATNERLQQALRKDLLAPRKDAAGREVPILEVFAELKRSLPSELEPEVAVVVSNIAELTDRLLNKSDIDAAWIARHHVAIRRIQQDIRAELSAWVRREQSKVEGDLG